jgi:hypothetical protein
VVEVGTAVCRADDIGDFDGDGDPDFLVRDDQDGDPDYLGPNDFALALIVNSDGARNLEERPLLAPRDAFSVARFGGDASTRRVLLLGLRGGGLQVYEREGMGLRAGGPHASSPAYVALDAATVADLDRDGISEVIAPGPPERPNEIHVLRACPGSR